jgi:hypothetical protein
MNWTAKILTLLFLAAAVCAAAPADPVDNKPAVGTAPDRKEDGKKVSSEPRDAKAKETHKTNAAPARGEADRRRELRNMTPEERAAKRQEIKERLEKRIAELRSRQTNATLTAQETRELERREQILKRFEQNEMPRFERPSPVITNSPAEN